MNTFFLVPFWGCYYKQKATGTTIDFFYSPEVTSHFHRALYPFTIELRPSGLRGGQGFILPASEIKPVGKEGWAAFRTMVEGCKEELTGSKYDL